MFPTNSERLIGISDAFSAFVYGYPSSRPRAQCTPNKSVPTLCYTRRPGPVYTGHACRHLPSAVPWISEDRLLTYCEKSLELQIFLKTNMNCVSIFFVLYCCKKYCLYAGKITLTSNIKIELRNGRLSKSAIIYEGRACGNIHSRALQANHPNFSASQNVLINSLHKKF